jgi:hypothetical protein
MHLATQSSSQLQTIFGGGYVIEQRCDEARRYLPPTNEREFAVDFSRILETLRAALLLRG